MPSWQGGAPCHLRLLSPASSLLPASPPHLAQHALVPLWVPFQPRGGVASARPTTIVHWRGQESRGKLLSIGRGSVPIRARFVFGINPFFTPEARSHLEKWMVRRVPIGALKIPTELPFVPDCIEPFPHAATAASRVRVKACSTGVVTRVVTMAMI